MLPFPAESLLLPILLVVALPGLMLALLIRQHFRHQWFQQIQLTRLQSLRDLILNLQRHRGLSTGVLSGDSGMRAELENRRSHLDRLIREAPMDDARYAERWSGIADHWSRLRQTDNHTVENNLDQHHQIIRNALFLIQDIAADDRVAPHPANQRCIWNEVLEAAEWSGQARALGTGMAAAGTSSAAQRVRMRFLNDKIQDLSGTAFEALKDAASSGVSNQHLKEAQQAVERLLYEVETELLTADPIVIPAKTYFDDATATVDALFTLVADTLGAMAEDNRPVRGNEALNRR
ncbi:nitrate- and nitrite sensing domain-containing protein [Salicola sp. Rm-C-2C1-2]|uniref:nitrate- and nitrite sensing domain-containing protein n=1 Tax=Salicola sp. Rm-C-2C1-2 TaxID=3141321 RepID=UPI0032E388D4